MESREEQLSALISAALQHNWESQALSDYEGKSYLYSEVGQEIIRLHQVFRDSGINPGDKVALLGKNSAYWGIIYLATITFGAVVVPILPDFKSSDIHTIITHSDSMILFAEESIFKELDVASMSNLKAIFSIPLDKILFTRIILPSSILQPPTSKIQLSDIRFPAASGDDLAVISYTSGTTGFSKGVMLQHKSLLGNILYAHRNMPLNPKDKILSFLPLAHTYGCAFEFLFPFTLGCDITFLTKTPSPQVIMQAFKVIRPALILSVPLVIEKIFKSQLLPVIRKPLMKVLMHMPGLNQIIFRKINRKLTAVFGGHFREVVIGGAPFNPEAEHFFKKIRFPFTVGYGMTECGPLISYASWKTTKLGASGRVVDELELRIDSAAQQTIPGEILVRGNHVMLGYYKNEEATRQVIDADGWLHTGDLGVVDGQGNIFIRGRSKNMILGASGKNIYPEEIESMLNNMLLVSESLVIQRNKKLTALIVPDSDTMKKQGISREQLPEIINGYIHEVNHRVPKYMKIVDHEIRETEFEKTPKRNIKRFIYQ